MSPANIGLFRISGSYSLGLVTMTGLEHIQVLQREKGAGRSNVSQEFITFHWLRSCKDQCLSLPFENCCHRRVRKPPFLVSQLCLTEVLVY